MTEMNELMSVYIPRVSRRYSVENVKQIFESLNIGMVHYIDLTPVNQKKGFNEIYADPYMSAFVHFSNCDNAFSQVVFWETIHSGKPHKLQLSPNEYWLCLKNINPVRRTRMNIHQVVENGRYLEEMVRNQQVEIENMREVVHMLISGLYNTSSQQDLIKVQKKLYIKGNNEVVYKGIQFN